MCSFCNSTRHSDGCPYKPEPVFTCPVCGRECESFIYSKLVGDILGCEHCTGQEAAEEFTWGRLV